MQTHRTDLRDHHLDKTLVNIHVTTDSLKNYESKHLIKPPVVVTLKLDSPMASDFSYRFFVSISQVDY